MLERIEALVSELRAVGVPIALSEKADALRALTLIPVGDREAVRATLSAALIKNASHEAAFQVIFALLPPPAPYAAGADSPGTGLPSIGRKPGPADGTPGGTSLIEAPDL